MSEPDISQVEQRLTAVLKKERREAIGYALLMVLWTPAFVVLAGLVILTILSYILHLVNNDYLYKIDVIDLYTLLNCFLAYMIVFILKHTFSPEDEYEFDITWLVAVVIFLVLLFITYATKLPVRVPLGFGILYTVTGFFILGLLGRVYLNLPVTEYDNNKDSFYALILAVTGFIAMSYGEFLSSSWLWIPPKPDEIRVCAWILCKLALEENMPLHHSDSVQKRVLYILSRLKYIQVKENRLKLTQKGKSFVIMDTDN